MLARTPTRGEHLLVYLNRGAWQLTPRVESALRALGRPVILYGTDRRGDDGLLSFRPPSNGPFLDDLAACRAVFSTAGNQLVGEALWLGKPMLVMPERTVEQRLNAAAVEALGIGRRVHLAEMSAEAVASFLRDVDRYRDTMRAAVRDGRAEAIAAIERFARELHAARPAPVRPAWEPA